MMRKTLWSPAEDETLKECVLRFGSRNWKEIARRTGLGRCPKSCRLRWFNYLRPDLKRTPFSPLEAALLLHLHAAFGNRWSKIAAHLPGRSDNDVKNFWHTLSRRAASCNLNMVNVDVELTGGGGSLLSDIIAGAGATAPDNHNVDIVDRLCQLLQEQQQQHCESIESHHTQNNNNNRHDHNHRQSQQQQQRGDELQIAGGDNERGIMRNLMILRQQQQQEDNYDDGDNYIDVDDADDDDDEEEDDDDSDDDEHDVDTDLDLDVGEHSDVMMIDGFHHHRHRYPDVIVDGSTTVDSRHTWSHHPRPPASAEFEEEAASHHHTDYWCCGRGCTTIHSATTRPAAAAPNSYTTNTSTSKPPEGLDLIVWNLLNPNQSVPSTWREY